MWVWLGSFTTHFDPPPTGSRPEHVRLADEIVPGIVRSRARPTQGFVLTVSTPPNCPQCSEDVQHRLQPFWERNRIAVASAKLTQVLLDQTEHHFPGVCRFILTPCKEEIEAARLFPINPKRVAADCLSLRLVDAPLPFTAAVITCQCRRCSSLHRVIHIGVPFYAVVLHMQAFLEGTHSESAEQLGEFFAGLHDPNPSVSDFPTPPASSVHRAIVASGMGWILCHEVGHFSADQFQPKTEISASPAAQSRFQEELNADFAALRILVHRTNARGPQRQPWLSLLYLGIGVMLRAWHVCIPPYQRAPDVFSYGPRLGAFAPSPTQRWEIVQHHLDLQFKLGFICEAEYLQLERRVLGDDTPKITRLLEELDVHTNRD